MRPPPLGNEDRTPVGRGTAAGVRPGFFRGTHVEPRNGRLALLGVRDVDLALPGVAAETAPRLELDLGWAT
jgi:hypothetical protein